MKTISKPDGGDGDIVNGKEIVFEELKTQANQASILQRQPLSDLGLKRCIFQQVFIPIIKFAIILLIRN